MPFTPALDRVLGQSTTVGAITGNDYMDDVALEVGGLWDRSCIKLDAIAGTADAITATVTPALTGALVDGMKFTFTPTAANTIAAVTLKIGSSAVTTIVDRDGNALTAGQLKSGRRHLIEYDSGLAKFRVLGDIEPAPAAATPLPSFRNILINGGCELFQRGAGDSASIAVAASTTAYTADRWYLTTGVSEACVVSAQAPLTDRSRKAARVQRNSGQTGTTALIFSYPLTTEECVRLRNTKCSLQAVFKAGANFSPTSGTLTYNVYFGTGTEGKRGAGFTGETNPITGSVNLTAGGAAQSISATSGAAVANNVTQGEVRFTWTPVGTAGAADSVDFDDIQLESGAAATAFEYLPFSVMLEDCRRHYAKTFIYGTAPAQNAGFIGAHMISAQVSGVALFSQWRFPVQMRATPSIVTYNPAGANANWREPNGPADHTVTVAYVENANTLSTNTECVFIEASTASTAGDGLYIHVSADAGL